MKPAPFVYQRARDLPQVFELLACHGEDAKLLAGGQSLMPALNMRLAAPAALIDISRVRELAGIRVQDGHVRIGALTTHAEVGRSAAIREHLPLLADAAPFIAYPAIRNAGTFGGSLATADPAAEWPACCVALDAQLVLASQTDMRRVAARDFFKGIYATAMRPDEVLTEVVIPIPAAGSRHAFIELARRRGDYAIAGVAALAHIGRDRVNALRLTFLGVGEIPVLATQTSQVLMRSRCSEDTLKEARDMLAHELDPAADLYTSAVTKRHLAEVLLMRAVTQLLEPARIS